MQPVYKEVLKQAEKCDLLGLFALRILEVLSFIFYRDGHAVENLKQQVLYHIIPVFCNNIGTQIDLSF